MRRQLLDGVGLVQPAFRQTLLDVGIQPVEDTALEIVADEPVLGRGTLRRGVLVQALRLHRIHVRLIYHREPRAVVQNLLGAVAHRVVAQ